MLIFPVHFSEKIRLGVIGIGIDLNPLPHLIPQATLNSSINPIFKAFEDDRYRLRQDESPYTHFLRADAHTIPIRDNSINLCWSVQTLNYATDPLRVIEEIYRTLAPDGFAALRITPEEITPNGEVINCSQIFSSAQFYKGNKNIKPSQVFQVNYGGGDYGNDFGCIIMKKPPGVQFAGFPFGLSQPPQYRKDRDGNNGDFMPYRKYTPMDIHNAQRIAFEYALNTRSASKPS